MRNISRGIFLRSLPVSPATSSKNFNFTYATKFILCQDLSSFFLLKSGPALSAIRRGAFEIGSPSFRLGLSNRQRARILAPERVLRSVLIPEDLIEEIQVPELGDDAAEPIFRLQHQGHASDGDDPVNLSGQTAFHLGSFPDPHCCFLPSFPGILFPFLMRIVERSGALAMVVGRILIL